MAISKILYMSEHKTGNKHQYLYNSIRYILNPLKTENKYVSAVNCLADLDQAYKQMVGTKKKLDKLDGRQGYHLIISFPEDFSDKEVGFDIIREFVNEYLGAEYEAIYSLHTDRKHLHGHIVFNSVKFTGNTLSRYYKYRYEKGDWKRFIQPLVDRICVERGLEPLEYNVDESAMFEESDKLQNGKYTQEEKVILNRNSTIKQDVDQAVSRAKSYVHFLEILRQKYEITEGKYLSLKSENMQRARRLGKTGRQGNIDELSEGYSIDEIKQKIRCNNVNKEKEKNERATRIPLWDKSKQGPFAYLKMYQYDLDEAIQNSISLQEVIDNLKGKGYGIIERGDRIFLRGTGIYTYIDSVEIGKLYAVKMIRQRLADNETDKKREITPRYSVVRIRKVRYQAFIFKRNKLTQFEKKRLSELYRLGIIKKRSYYMYSQYKEQIKNFNKLQEEYLFTREYDIKSYDDLENIIEALKETRKRLNSKKNSILAKKSDNEIIENLYCTMKDKFIAYDLYLYKDMTFFDDARDYINCINELNKLGYTYAEVERIIENQKKDLEEIAEEKRVINKKILIAKRIKKSKDEQRERIELRTEKGKYQVPKERKDGRL